jgi:molybdopterin synthase catalytic subunit
MKVRVRMFAGLVALVGAREIEVDVRDGATASMLKAHIGELHPAVVAFLPSVVCAVGEEYVAGDFALADGDFVALIPPVSGGTA